MPNAIKVTFGFETIDEASSFLDFCKNAPNNSTKPRDALTPPIRDPDSPATDKQKSLMTKLNIKWDESTTKQKASDLISEKMEGA